MAVLMIPGLNEHSLKSLIEVLRRNQQNADFLRAVEVALPQIAVVPQPLPYWRGEALFNILATRRHRKEPALQELDFRTDEEKREDRALGKYPFPLLTAAWEARLLAFHRRVFPLLKDFETEPHRRLLAIRKVMKEEERQKAGSYRTSRAVAMWAEVPALASIRCLAQKRLHQTLLAVLYQRQRTGELPAQLGTDLIDPFDGKPLRYLQRDGAVVLYCVGNDLKDDGGSEERSEKTDQPRDMVLRFPLTERST